MSFSSSAFPYDTVVYVTDTIGGSKYQASGVLIAPNEVLTASHVVWSTGVGTASKITVTPAYNRGAAPYGSATGVNIHYNAVDDAGDMISLSDSQSDFALIHLASPLTVGVMTLGANFSGGAVQITGYPAFSSGAMVDSQQTVTQDPHYNIFDGTALGAGSSGGPVWITASNGSPEVVGLVSSGSGTNGYFVQLTSADITEIDGWLAQDNTLSAQLAAVTTVVDRPSSGGVVAGQTVSITLTLNETVTVTGVPTLSLNDGATAHYSGGSGSAALTFLYTAAAGDGNVQSLMATAINLNGGTIADPNGAAASLSLGGLTQSGPEVVANVPGFVQQLYTAMLFRQGGSGDVGAWAAAFNQGVFTPDQTVADFAGSAEAQNYVLPVTRLYQTFFDRAPDSTGLSYWVNALRGGESLTAIATGFVGAAEFQQHYGVTADPTAFVTALYQNVLGRAPDLPGEQYWVAQLGGTPTVATETAVALGFAQSAEFVADSSAPIEAWLSQAAWSGTYGSSIAYQSVAGTATASSQLMLGVDAPADLAVAGPGIVALSAAYAAGLTNGAAAANAVVQVAAGGIDTTAAGGTENVFFVAPHVQTALTSAASVAAAIGAVKTGGTDAFVVILDDGATAASSSGFGVYAVTAHETAGGAVGGDPADGVQLLGLFTAANGFSAGNYHAPILA